MRKVLLATAAITGLFMTTALSVSAQPYNRPVPGPELHHAPVNADYYWHHQHYQHRHWEHNHWRYY
jgi:hypothetical protein